MRHPSFFNKHYRQSIALIVLLVFFLFSLNFTQAAPVDPITGSSPSFDAAPEEGTNYNSGDWGVSEQNGAATYTFNIDVPSGRNGMAPSLSLRYSSNLPLRGGLAVGWDLHIPSIERDFTLGFTEETQYKINLGSAAGRLVEVSDTSPYPNGKAYRVHFDNSNTRIFSSNSTGPQPGIKEWIALTPDGIRHYFGEESRSSIKGIIWHITSQVDPHGNTIRYNWSDIFNSKDVYLGQSLTSIEYTSNESAGLVPHAKVEFEYDIMKFCRDTDTSKLNISDIPIGAAYRKGGERPQNVIDEFKFLQVTGAQQLAAIKIHVRDSQASDWRLSKRIDLKYRTRNSSLFDNSPVFFDESSGSTPSNLVMCNQNPLRYLTQIDVEAFTSDGVGTPLPPVNFQYNNRIDTSRPTLVSAPFGIGKKEKEQMLPITVEASGFGQEGTSGTKLGGLKKTLLDIDNDGIRDQVSVVEENMDCILVWYKGELGGTFDPVPHKSTLPTAAWYQEWRGFPNAVLENEEGCTLSGQIAYRSTSIVSPPPPHGGKPSSENVKAKGIVSYHFMDYTGDGRLDLITNVWESSGCHWTYDPWEIPKDGNSCSFGQDFETEPRGVAKLPLSPEKISRNGKRFKWRVYPGTGNPDKPFLDNLTRPRSFSVASPLALPPSAGEETLDTTPHINYSVPVLFDLDGDGFLDIIASGRGAQKNSCNNKILLTGCNWTVYFGNGTGEFPTKENAHIWDVPTVDLASDEWDLGTRGGDIPFIQRRDTVIKLIDINGDGLADLVVRKGDGNMYSYRNTGRGFAVETYNPINGTTALEEVKTDIDQLVANTLTDGDRGYLRRLLDLDGDGLLDMVWFESSDKSITSTDTVKAKFNLGGRFGHDVTLIFPEKWAKAKRLLSAKWQQDFEGTWHIATDFTDVSGDGLADLVQWHGDTMSYISSPGLPKAPDMLSQVTNGRGMKLTFSYAPSSNHDVVTWTDNKSALPRVTWVVKETTITGGLKTPTITTQYQYQNPRYLSAEVYSGHKERSQFAGFAENIQTTNYANGTSKQIRKHYNYTGLHGELVNIQTFHDGQLHRAVRKEWGHKTLFNDNIQVALPTMTTTCITNAPDMNEEGCFAQDDHVHRAEKTWQQDSVSHQFLNMQHVEGSGNSAQAGDHGTSYLYDIRYGTVTGHNPEDYRVRTRETKDAIRDSFNNFDTIIGLSKTDFNAETGLPDRSHSFFDASVVAIIKFTYDVLTGNLLKIQKPAQSLLNGGTDTFSAFSYDSHKLFVHEMRNELGHLTTTTNDVASGILIKRQGPNAITSSAQTVFDTERWQIDGFGRVLSHSISIDTEINGSADYEERIVQHNTYNDLNFINLGKPVSVRVEQLRDFNSTQHWIPTEQDFDGKGRVLETRQLFNGTMTKHTTYSYGCCSDGLSSIEMPDPRNNTDFVTYTYSRDGLGRVTLLERPDETSVSVTYEGLRQTISDETPDGTGGSKTKRFDVIGRLVELQEHGSDVSSAITLYQYDAVDNLEKIIDAEGNITRMSHDWKGNRIGINRGQRNWQYRYDLNSNLISKSSPMPAGSNPAHYTTSYTYDDLDRLQSKSFADMHLSTAPSFTTNAPSPTGVISSIHYQYDEGHNSVGRLSQVDLPFGVVAYNYDVRGLITKEQRSFTLDQIANMTTSQQVRRSYNALGQLTESNWQGGQRWLINYDERGLVDSVDWFDPTAITWKSVANYERDLIGLPLVRNTGYGQTRSFTYDALARPLTDSVKLDSGATMLAERSYAYTGVGNLASVIGHTNGVDAKASYTYDLQHRLLSANAPNGYQGSFTYSPTGNVLSANVSWNNASETRNVNYSYGQVDPQAVDTLQDITTGGSYADFAYDDVGNMTWRSTPDGDTLLHWDGLDQIRRADTADGSETYYYDHMGQRMVVVNPGQGVRFWFGEREIHYNLDGTETLNYLHLSAGGPTLARIENGTTIELQYADALQNLMFSLDKESNVTASFLYGPFGEVVSETGSEAHRRQFNGKENDVTTGLRYYGYRYYDQLVLRWNSADPLYTVVPELGKNQPQRMNLYAFSLNNPVRYMDPDGREAGDSELDDDGTGGGVPSDETCRSNPERTDCIHKEIYGPDGNPYGGTLAGDSDTEDDKKKPKDASSPSRTPSPVNLIIRKDFLSNPRSDVTTPSPQKKKQQFTTVIETILGETIVGPGVGNFIFTKINNSLIKSGKAKERELNNPTADPNTVRERIEPITDPFSTPGGFSTGANIDPINDPGKLYRYMRSKF